MAYVAPEFKQLYEILEVQFHPLSICKKIAPIIQKLNDDGFEFSRYVKPLHQVVLTRLLQQLSQVYSTIKIDSIVQLVNNSFPEPFNYNAYAIEKFVMNRCKKGDLSVRMNHATRTITFKTNIFSISPVSQGTQVIIFYNILLIKFS